MGGKGRTNQGKGAPLGQPQGMDGSAMEETPLPMKTVIFPCDLPNWAGIKVALQKLGSVRQVDKLISQLNKIYTLIIEGTTQLLGPTEPERFIFDNLKRFLTKKCSDEEVHAFYNIILPCIVDRAVQIEQLKPAGGLAINKQQQGCEIELPRPLVASIVSCAFLCLFPGRKRDRRSKLNSINFLGFFKQLPSGPQCAKLRCVLHYFERLAADPQGPAGNIVFKRQVMSQHRLPSLADWLSCDIPLCPMVVHQEGGIEDAGSATMQVDFANRYIGGGAVTGGKVQEEIRFCLSPELIASMLFMECMEDNEAIHIQGFETYSKYTGYSKTLKFAGMCIDPAKTDAKGNLENMLCAIDATPFKRNPRDQYTAKCVLRELNKAYVGFLQAKDVRRPSYMSVGKRTYRNSSMTSDEDDFFSAIESLDSEDPEASGPDVSNLGVSMGEAILASAVKDAVDSNKSHDQSSHGSTGLGDGEEGLGLLPGIAEGVEGFGHSNIDQLEADRAWLMAIRRRSSQLSDMSRRSSSSTKTSSEMSSEFEEYFESFQRHEHRLRHTAIKEEPGTTVSNNNPAVNQFASKLAASLLKESSSIAAQSSQGLPNFDGSKPPNVTRPKAIRPSPQPAGSPGVRTSSTSSNETDDQKSRNRISAYVDRLLESAYSGVVGEAASAAEPAYQTIQGNLRDQPQEVQIAAHFVDNVLSEALSDPRLQRTGQRQCFRPQRRQSDPVVISDSSMAEVLSANNRGSRGSLDLGIRSQGIREAHPSLTDDYKQSVADEVTTRRHSDVLREAPPLGNVASRLVSQALQQVQAGPLPTRPWEEVARPNRFTEDSLFLRRKSLPILPHERTQGMGVHRKDAGQSGIANKVQSIIIHVSNTGNIISMTTGLQDAVEGTRSGRPCVAGHSGVKTGRANSWQQEHPRITASNLSSVPVHFSISSPDGDSPIRFSTAPEVTLFDSEEEIRPRPSSASGFRDATLSSFADMLLQSSPGSPGLPPMFSTEPRRPSLDKLGLDALSRRSSGSSRTGSSDKSPLGSSRRGSADRATSGFNPRESTDKSSLGSSGSKAEARSSASFSSCASDKISTKLEDIFNTVGTDRPNPVETYCFQEKRSSCESVLKWLDSPRRGCDSRAAARRRTQSLTSHLDWFVEDLLIDAFNDAFIEMFGEHYFEEDVEETCTAEKNKTEKSEEDRLFIFAEKFARDILVEALNINRRGNKSAEGEMDTDSTESTYQDAIDVPYNLVESLASRLAGTVLVEAVQTVGTRTGVHGGRSHPWRRWSKQPSLSSYSALFGLEADGTRRRPIVTGNWGCGAFRGDGQLKSLLQWMSASLAGTPWVVFYTFGSDRVAELDQVAEHLLERQWTVGTLLHNILKCIQQFHNQTPEVTDDSDDQLVAAEGSSEHSQHSMPDLFDVLLQQ